MTRSILIVDDSESHRGLMRSMLGDCGHQVLAAASDEQALEIARLARPILVVAAVAPGPDGFELARRLRGELSADAMQLVFWTAAFDHREVREAAQALQVQHILSKPCDASEVRHIVNQATLPARSSGTAGPGDDLDGTHIEILNDKLLRATDDLERAQQALRRSEERFRLLVAHIPGAVYRRAFDRDLTVEFIGDEIEQITGYPAWGFTGSRQRTYASVIHPDDRARVAEEIRTAIERHSSYGLAYRVITASGEEVWVGDRGRAVDEGDGNHVWLYGTLSDVTRRKRLEADRDRMEIELRMAQKLEAVGQLAAGIAHEINTPVQFVGDSVQFLRDSFEDLQKLLDLYREPSLTGPDRENETSRNRRIADLEEEIDLPYLQERVPAAIERTLEGVDRVASIVRAMKEFAHPQAEQAPADLNEALKTTLTVARNEYKYVARVQTQFAALPPVICNLSDLNQVFLNLIVNAAHAIEDAQKAQGDLGTIGIRTAHDRDSVLVRISDTGCGIPPEVRTRMFDPFFTTKAVGRGSGQGLAIARAIVERHAGTLECTSEVGSGTTFTIRLPIEGTRASGSAVA